MITSLKKPSLPENICRMSLDLDTQLHKKIKIAAAKKRVTMRSLVVDIIKEHFQGQKA
jgi:predicted HicB family RNase H-like nuclease